MIRRRFSKNLTQLPLGSTSRGSALLLVLWCVVILGTLVIGLAALVEQGARRTSSGEFDLRARSLALTGIALGFQVDLNRDDPLLHQQTDSGHQLTVMIAGEGGRLNLNFLLVHRHQEILARLFESWGVSSSLAQQVARSLEEHVLSKEKEELVAEEFDSAQPGLTQRAKRPPFMTLHEVSMVLGMDQIMRQHPDWQDSLTLWSHGPLDVNEASPELLSAFFNIPRSRAEQWVRTRNGPDGILGTEDDRTISEVTALKELLGLGDDTLQSVGDLISFQDPIRRVTSASVVEGRRVSLTAVAEVGKVSSHYYLWSEE